ncbi:MAG TPA: tRNA lysidine(34) synthetase TilS [Chitinophagaceae bacterium]|nr:tRNA lysidine(34) synthetase TilS [Chitinophagaceae bacterium]
MNLLQRFRDCIQQNNLFQQRDRLLVAVSGGVDSVVLCELCRQAGFDFVLVHCNFQLRGAESDRDEQFVRDLGKKYAVEVLVRKFDTQKYAAENKKGIQEAARDLRYDWFTELIANYSHDSLPLAIRITTHVLTAHHADDNIETVLMNFCRGTGLHGLDGIPHKSGYVRRPLLDFWKHELVEFAGQNNVSFVEDSSNAGLKYTRNLFRNEIIPSISKVYPQVKTNLHDNINRFKDVNQLYARLVDDLKNKVCKKKNREVHIPIKQLLSFQNKALIFEIISDYGFGEKQIDEVIKLCDSESGRFIQSPGSNYRIIKFRNWLIISPIEPINAETILIHQETNNIQCSTFNLQISIVSNSHADSYRGPTANSVAWMDADEIEFPLILRRWKQGDYFYPLGMRKKKKLARFFIDKKLSKTERENIWVLETNKKIIWVVGFRIDDRFKITNKTKKILKIALETG